MTEEIQGIVKKTIFSSKDGRFCVFLIEEKESGKTVTVSLNSELSVNMYCCGGAGSSTPVLGCSSKRSRCKHLSRRNQKKSESIFLQAL